MLREKVGVVIFEGGRAHTEVEERLLAVRKGVALDNTQKAMAADGVDEVILATNYPDLADRAGRLGVTINETEGTSRFHFGEHLQHVVDAYELDSVIYLGGATLPLIRVDDFSDIAEKLRRCKNVVVVNNVQSADLTAFTPGSMLQHIESPDNDNFLGFLLREAGLRRILIQNSARINFDIDAPMDVLILQQCKNVGPSTRAALSTLDMPNDHLIRALQVIERSGHDQYAELALVGRVSPVIMSVINANLGVRLRAYSEERGMKALSREDRGEVVSLIGHFLESVGSDAFFSYLASVADVALIDTRVLMSHLNLRLPAGDRFNSDLGLVDEIENDWLREFTEAAYNAPIPVVLGGHSLIYGGLWAVLDERGLLERGLPDLPS